MFKDERVTADINSDIKYIKNDLICKQPNGAYCKFSRPLNAVATYNFKYSDYIAYWTSRHKFDKNEYEKIKFVCIEKLHSGLISLEKMIELVKQSNDFETEKEHVLKYLTQTVKQTYSGKLRNKYLREGK